EFISLCQQAAVEIPIFKRKASRYLEITIEQRIECRSPEENAGYIGVVIRKIRRSQPFAAHIARHVVILTESHPEIHKNRYFCVQIRAADLDQFNNRVAGNQSISVC